MQAPHSMKSTIMSLWLLTVFFGNILDAAITKLNLLSGLPFFLFFAFLMFLVAVLFIWAAMKYQMRDYSVLGSEVRKVADGETEENNLLFDRQLIRPS